MGGRRIRATSVCKAVALELKQPILPGHRIPEPPWFRIMNWMPPAESLVRTIPPRHYMPDPKSPKPKKLYRPQRIGYLEDALRSIFYRDHPWELARPRVILELDGKDYQHVDWSTGLQQPHVPLTGECVVQRQLWLMQNKKMSKRQAYDSVRHEFYRLRQAEEIEKRIAIEEARHVGAYFGKSAQDVGLLLEDREFEKWKAWAGKESAAREARQNQVETFEVAADADSVVESRPVPELAPTPNDTID